MQGGQAIATGLRQGLTFEGRTSHSGFWGFAPTGIALPVATGAFVAPSLQDLATFLAKITLIGVASVPLTAAAARRYQDTGLPAGDLWIGLRPTALVIVSGWFLLLGLFGIVSIVHTLLGLLIFLCALLPFLVNLFLVPATVSASIGQLLLPSQDGTNSYGPNPHEVHP